MTPRRLWIAALIGAAGGFVIASPASAHGVGGRSDLPLPAWLFAYGAGGAVAVSFAALGLLWPASRMERGVEGRTTPVWFDRFVAALAPLGRLLGLAAFGLVVAAAVAGEPDAAFNLAPTAVYVFFWIGLQAVSALVGDVWRVLSPFDTLAAAGAWLRRRVVGDRPPRFEAPGWGHWPAAVLLLGFVWLELVYVDPASPRALAVAIVAYSAVVLTGAAVWGRSWLRRGEAFAAWFGLLAHMAVFHRDAQGRLRVRPPLAGLVHVRVLPGTAALVLVALGSTSFDGIERTQFWDDIVGARTGWEAVPINTLGLLWAIGVVAVLYLGAMRVAARVVDRDPTTLAAWFVHSLVPIAFAYAVAHYFSLFVFEGQAGVALLSDPLGRGWDLFGTAHHAIDYGAVSTSTIAWVQAGSIVAGHVAGVVVAHDRAVARLPDGVAARSQYPLLVTMIVYTVGGLGLLLGA